MDNDNNRICKIAWSLSDKRDEEAFYEEANGECFDENCIKYLLIGSGLAVCAFAHAEDNDCQITVSQTEINYSRLRRGRYYHHAAKLEQNARA